MTPEFQAWPKIPRLNRDVTITEKIDGTNACVIVTEDGEVYAQSRKRIITPESDNFGFAAWAHEHRDDLVSLGVGYHYGEWFGSGIQRGYGLDEKRFALFNPDKADVMSCCTAVPVLTRTTGNYLSRDAHTALSMLRDAGSAAVPGFMRPEGIIVYHHAARTSFKVLLEGDDVPKGVAA